MFALSKIVFLTIHNCNEFDPQYETHFIKGHNKCDCFQRSSLRGVRLYFTKCEWLSCLSQTRQQWKRRWNGGRQISHRWLTEEMANLSSVYCLVSKLIFKFRRVFLKPLQNNILNFDKHFISGIISFLLLLARNSKTEDDFLLIPTNNSIYCDFSE